MKVMFVCLGNICRSPSAEAILKKMADERGLSVNVESSGLGDWHIGQLADSRTREHALKRGFALTGRAKKFLMHFMDEFDYVLAADHKVLHQLQRAAATPEQKSKIHLMTAFSSAFKNVEVPDPFYGGEAAFEHVLDILEDSCEGLLDHLEKIHKKL
jgi:protein-tyrosine phosphatase